MGNKRKNADRLTISVELNDRISSILWRMINARKDRGKLAELSRALRYDQGRRMHEDAALGEAIGTLNMALYRREAEAANQFLHWCGVMDNKKLREKMDTMESELMEKLTSIKDSMLVDPCSPASWYTQSRSLAEDLVDTQERLHAALRVYDELVTDD